MTRPIRLLSLFTAFLVVLSLCGCDNKSTASTTVSKHSITDSEGNTFMLPDDPKVAVCYSSFADAWLLAGGKLAGVTDDAVTERKLISEDEAQIIGTVKSIDAEKLVALSPDYVILSEDLTAHQKLKQNLEDMNISYGYFRVDTFEDYAKMMEQFCNVTGRDDLFKKNVTDVKARIDAILAKIPKDPQKTVLLARAFSTGMKAKTDDNLAGQILKEYGLKNIANSSPSLLEDLSLEHIIKADPDYIFTFTMGSEEGAKAYLESEIESSPAFSGLSAVKNNNYHLLPKELFHYKPNNRWDESYEYLAKIIYPEIFE